MRVDMGMNRRTEATTKYWLLVAVLALIAELFLSCVAQSFNDAATYLDNVESEVLRVAAKASENFVNTCDLVESCGGACSRQSCQPLEGDIQLLTCKNVALNPTCNDVNGNMGCSQLRVMLSRSFVRLPTTPDINVTSADNYAICSQRMLDPLFLNISKVHNNAINLTSWFYLGSVEGVHRSFPGRDVSPTKCTFEPRKRPWFMAATAVRKDLIILLDGGNSMGDALPGDIFIKDFTKFAVSVNMIKELLDTLNYGDRVSVVLYSSSTSATLVMNMTSTGNSTDIQPLKTALDALLVDTNPGTSNLLAGIQKANATFLSPPDPAVLKIMVLITDGQFADNTALPPLLPFLASFRSQQVLTLLYSFDRTDTAKTSLSQLACAVNGTYERILKTVRNPLWTMRSYFGIIAFWRLQAVNFKPYWSKPYEDSGSLSEVLTVAYPVFAPDNYTLVGVVGSDVIMSELGSFANTDFSAALSVRTSDQSYAVKFVPLPCHVQLSTNNTCLDISAPVNPLCAANDTSNLSFAERVCDCPQQCKAPQEKRPVSSAVIGTAAGGGALALLIVAISLVTYVCRPCRTQKIENQDSGYALSIISHQKDSNHSNSKPARTLIKGLGSGQSSEDSQDVAMQNSTYSSSSSTRRRESIKAPAWPTGSKSLSRDVVAFTMSELELATQNWSVATLLGKGGCGSVYKGTLLDIARAIKKPHDGVEVANSTFNKELDLLSKLNHKCLVRLIGYCIDEHVLVFEYMSNGTLEDCLHKDRLQRSLTWEERLRIAAGAAKGLEYLHEYATTMIIHGDVKPANILLDEKLEAHISDFGLSLSTEDADASMMWASKMGGTPGYFPEYADLGSSTPKSDVYSFGIVLLELLSGRKVVQENQNISTWAVEIYKRHGVWAMLDPEMEKPRESECFHTVIELALKCVHKDQQFRPKMKDVSAVLSNVAAAWQTFERGRMGMGSGGRVAGRRGGSQEIRKKLKRMKNIKARYNNCIVRLYNVSVLPPFVTICRNLSQLQRWCWNVPQQAHDCQAFMIQS